MNAIAPRSGLWALQEVTATGYYSEEDRVYGSPQIDDTVAETQLQAVRLALGRNLTRAHVAGAA